MSEPNPQPCLVSSALLETVICSHCLMADRKASELQLPLQEFSKIAFDFLTDGPENHQ